MSKKICGNPETIEPYKLITDRTVKQSDSACFVPSSPFMHNNFYSIPSNTVDIESELRGQNYLLSSCPENKYNPTVNKIVPPTTSLQDCKDQSLNPEYSRIKKPCNLPGVNINRFHPLVESVQEIQKIHSNSIFGKNSRTYIKDEFAKKEEAKKQLSFTFSNDGFGPYANLKY